MRLCFECLRQSAWAATRFLVAAAAVSFGLTLAFFLVFRFIDPPASSLMVTQRLSGRQIDQRWVPLAHISPNLVRAVIHSEDARFCGHWGIDPIELRAAVRRSQNGQVGAVRGASTISMQVVKNLMLWPDQSLARKGLELVITPVMELVWPKRRILEVYLNIAEWGPGIFGAEAAARRHFGKSAARLTRRQAALLAAALPNPIRRRPARPTANLNRRARTIARRASARGLNVSCVSQQQVAAKR